MVDYDFKALNDKEFEVFCADLLSAIEEVHIERFKQGKDKGIDGRYFSDGIKIILQCKHWLNTGLPQLLSHLNTVEKDKVAKLQPTRYILAISKPLSASDKSKIRSIFNPYIISESDIWGLEDLNDFLKRHPEVEKNHYKLWIQNSSVLTYVMNNATFGRSRFTYEQIIQRIEKYVVTDNHKNALEKLQQLGVVIISGEPGVGKTTLAEHMSIECINSGYEFIQIEDGIQEAEAVYDPAKKQVFYYDDFLGRNYLEAVSAKSNSRVFPFIKRINSHRETKRFILTSRSTILNQGWLLMDGFVQGNLKSNEYLLTVSGMSYLDKAKILYNHLWYGNLPEDYLDEFYRSKKYMSIIRHKNFNPRLISYITDYTRFNGVEKEDFWDEVIAILDNPKDVWENPFNAQQDDYTRAIVILVTLNRKQISEEDLSVAYYQYLSLPGAQGLSGRRDLLNNLEHLTESLLNRYINSEKEISYDLFNPSLGDYVIKRYKRDIHYLSLCFRSLKSDSSLDTLESLIRNKDLNKSASSKILQEISHGVKDSKFDNYSVNYIAKLFSMLREHGAEVILSYEKIIGFLLDQDIPLYYFDVLEAFLYGYDNGFIEVDLFLRKLDLFLELDADENDLNLLSEIMEKLNVDKVNQELINNKYIEVVKQFFLDNIADEVNMADIFSNIDYDDKEKAYAEVLALVEGLLSRYYIDSDRNLVTEIVDSYDYVNELEEYHQSLWQNDDYHTNQHLSYVDNIDDLFDRR